MNNPSRKSAVLFPVLVLGGALALLVLESLRLDLYYEEPRRIAVALGIRGSGEWLLPHIFGQPYLKKPPGFNWLIYLFAAPFPHIYVWTARAVSIASWLGIAALVRGLVRRLTSPDARRIAVFASLFSLLFFLEKAALAELDLAFSFFLFLGLAGWFELRSSGRPAAAWYWGHLGLLIAFFIKGPVAHLFFYPPLIAWFRARRERPEVRPALLGAALCHLPIAVWVVYLIRRIPAGELGSIAAGEMIRSSGGGGLRPGRVLLEFLTFPPTVWISFLPFGLFFLCLLSPPIRKSVAGLIRRRGDPAGELAGFSLAATAPFVFFWIYPVHTVRYVMPVFPWLAVLVGVTARQLADSPAAPAWTRRFYLSLGLLGVFLLIFFPLRYPGAHRTPVFAGLWLLLALLAAWFFRQSRGSRPSLSGLAGGMAVLLILIKVFYLGYDMPYIRPERIGVRERLDPAVSWLRERGVKEVYLLSGHSLEIPYYLHREGIRSVLVEIPPASGYLLLPRLPEEELGRAYEFPREHERDFFIVVIDPTRVE